MSTSVPAATLAALLDRHYGLAGTCTRVSGENENYLVESTGGTRHVLKLAGDDQDDRQLELQHVAAEALAQAPLGLTLPRIVRTRDGELTARITLPDGRIARGRLLQFVPGTPWAEMSAHPSALRHDLGRCLAGITQALRAVEHPGMHRTHKWDLTAAHAHRPSVALTEDRSRRQLLHRAFTLYEACAQPTLRALPRQLIHGDLNDENVLVAQGHVSGLLDFGDALAAPAICELAVALTYATLDERDPLGAGSDIVAGFHEVTPLSGEELELLFPLICGRLAASLCIAAQRRRIDPDRSSWFVTEPHAWSALAIHLATDPRTAARRLASGTGVPVFALTGAPREQLRSRREARIGAAVKLSFDQPARFVRGERQFLFEEDGRPFLDLYNNVAHVGHCHPRVVEAGQRQMARLNTNTRYLYDELTTYADRLAATLPAPLEVCFIVNSGSEANELAIRLARAHTRAQDFLIVDHAYHGHTNTLIDLSPYKFMGKGGEGRPKPWVHITAIPDGYRGAHRGQGRDAGVAYGDDVARVIASLDRPPAAFLAESFPSCGGQVIPPDGYLETVFRHVRAAGGVCILDEVQTGFGRVGERYWAFEMQGVVPDIVVMGKPMGNGHPLGAVVTTRTVADSFAADGMEFFSTFGGNPVSCAIGLAVLDVIRDERLQENALAVGTQLRDGLRALMARHERIGDVRGSGLFIGVELVRDRASRLPATREAAALVNALRARQILTGTDGPFHNVVKIKGPLVATADDAAMAIDAFDEALAAIDP